MCFTRRFTLIPSSMFSPSIQSGLRGLSVFGALLLCVSGETVHETRSGMIHELRAALADLAEDWRTYLCRLAGEQTVLSVQKAFCQVLGVVARGVATALNVLIQYVSHFMQAVGIQVLFPINKVTPEGLIFVVQWVLVALIGYWLISLTFQLVISTLRRTLWVLKVGLAFVCFGVILRDHSVGPETMAIRLAVLVFVCVVLGVGSSSSSNATEKTAHLEEQVKLLERRLRQMERWRRTEE